MKANVMISPVERARKRKDNRYLILRFLRDEVFSDSEVLSKVLGLSQASSVNKILDSMCKDNLLIKHRESRKMIWGINSNGVLSSFKDNEEIPEKIATFRASKFNILTFEHKKHLQLCRVKSKDIGWTNWTTPRVKKGFNCPDGIVENAELKIAVEYERTLKQKKRYDSIVKAHLDSILSGRYKKVLYISPNVPLIRRVERIFTSYIDSNFIINERALVLSKDAFNAIFEFQTLDDFLKRKS